MLLNNLKEKYPSPPSPKKKVEKKYHTELECRHTYYVFVIL